MAIGNGEMVRATNIGRRKKEAKTADREVAVDLLSLSFEQDVRRSVGRVRMGKSSR